MKKSLLLFFAVIISSITIAESKSSTQIPSLTSEQLSSFRTFIKQGVIEYYEGSEQIVRINPDIWNAMDFTRRKGFTENLCIYICRYIKNIAKVEDWWVQVDNMATRKKLARWMGGIYKEF
jgi:hypothetical protein